MVRMKLISHCRVLPSQYLQRHFFMDVHPPLAKLLITFAGWLGGYKGGSEDFKDIAKSGRPHNSFWPP